MSAMNIGSIGMLMEIEGFRQQQPLTWALSEEGLYGRIP